MRKNTKSQYKSDGDFRSLFKRLSLDGNYGYKGKQKSLIESFFFWTEHHPSKSKLFTRASYNKRARDLTYRIIISNEYPRNYIRANDRYGMLDIIMLLTSF